MTDEAQGELPSVILAPLGAIERFMEREVEALGLPARLDAAVRHGLLNGGKRLRPLLAVHCSVAVGGTLEEALPAAGAVEMIHAFSLIHDDLPALDDDDLRRGQPTVHVAHGEANAILAGDTLMSAAFHTLSRRCPDPVVAALLSSELASGTTSMIVGQVYDTLGGLPEGLSDLERVSMIHENKTGALIRASCRMGAIAGIGAGALSGPALSSITRYAEAIGLMFQVVDDLLDVEQTSDHVGKRTAKDADQGKVTYPEVIGVDGARREVDRLRSVALGSVEPLGDSAAPLVSIAEYLAVRTR